MKDTKLIAPFSKKLLIGLLGSLGVLIIVHLVLQYLNLIVFSEQNVYVFEISNRLDFDDEASVPTWFSQALFLSIGLVALLIRHYSKNRNERNAWLSIGVIGLVFSIDEVATIHETVLQLLHITFLEEGTTSAKSNAWLFVAPFILLVLALIARKAIATLNRRTALLLSVGMLIIVSGAIFIDIIVVEFPASSFLREGIMAALEESLELLGAIVMLYACVDYLERMKPELFVSAKVSAPVAKK